MHRGYPTALSRFPGGVTLRQYRATSNGKTDRGSAPYRVGAETREQSHADPRHERPLSSPPRAGFTPFRAQESANSRPFGRGVLIYWHVERKSMAIHSQLISCTASEVAAMVEGAMRHGTTMEVEGNYVDSHGQSEVGFGVTRLLGFDL